MKSLTPILVLGLLFVNCAGYRPRLVTPAQTALTLEARSLHDPRLRTFIARVQGWELEPWPPSCWDLHLLTLVAFYFNPQLAAARADLWRVESARVSAAAWPNPSLSLDAEKVLRGGGQMPWVLGAVLGLPIENMRQRGYRIARARYLAEAAYESLASKAWAVRREVRGSLLTLFGVEKAEDLLVRRQELQERIVEELTRQMKLGEIDAQAVNTAKAALQQIILERRQNQLTEHRARARLAVALGVPQDTLRDLRFCFNSLGRMANIHLPPQDSLRKRVLLERTDIQAALARYAVAEQTVALEIQKRYPHIMLGPGYILDEGEEKIVLQPEIELPLLNRNAGPIGEALARRAKARAELMSTQNAALARLQQALSDCQAAAAAMVSADSMLMARMRSENYVRKLHEAGELGWLSAARVELEALESRQRVLEARLNYLDALAKLEDIIQFPLDVVTFDVKRIIAISDTLSLEP